MYNFRTDLASERREIYQKANHLENEVPGIESEELQEGENIKITKVKIPVSYTHLDVYKRQLQKSIWKNSLTINLPTID